MDIYDLRHQLSEGKSIYELPLRVTFYARVSTGTDEQASMNNISFNLKKSKKLKEMPQLVINNGNRCRYWACGQ